MSTNKRTYDYDEELTTITGDELLHADLSGYTYAKKTKISTVFSWIKTSLTGFFIRSINGTYPDANSNIALTYLDVGAGSAQSVADNTANILVLDGDLEDLSQDVVINTALSIDNEGRITVNEGDIDDLQEEVGNLKTHVGSFTYDQVTLSTTETRLGLTLVTQSDDITKFYIDEVDGTLDIFETLSFLNYVNCDITKSGATTVTVTYRLYEETAGLYKEFNCVLSGTGLLTPSVTIDVKDRPAGSYYATMQLDSDIGTIVLNSSSNVAVSTVGSGGGLYQLAEPSEELTTVDDNTSIHILDNKFSLLSTIKTYLTTAFNLLYVPLTRTVNSKALSTNIELDADDVGAVPTGITYNIANTYSIPSTTPSNSVFHFNGSVESTFTMPVHDTVDEEWFITIVNHATTDVKLNIVSNITDVSLVDWTDYYIIPNETSKIRRNDNNEYIVMQCHNSNTVNNVALGVDGNYDLSSQFDAKTDVTDFNAHLADISDGAHSENNYTDSEKATVDGNYNRSITNQDDIIALELDVSNKVSFDTTKPTNESTLLIDDNNNLTSSIKKIGVRPTDSEITKLFENIPKIANGFLDFDLLVYRSGTSGAYCGKIEFNFNFNSGALIIKRIDENLKYTKNSFGINYSAANDSHYFYMTTPNAFDYFAVQINTQITRDYGLPMSLDDFNFVGTALTELPASIVLSEYSSVNTNLISAPSLYTDATGLIKSAKTVYSYTLAQYASTSTIPILPFGVYTISIKQKLSSASAYDMSIVIKFIGAGNSGLVRYYNLVGSLVDAYITLSSTGFVITNNADDTTSRNIVVSVILEDNLADD